MGIFAPLLCTSSSSCLCVSIFVLFPLDRHETENALEIAAGQVRLVSAPSSSGPVVDGELGPRLELALQGVTQTKI